jgi:Uma2 family endonuclease
MATISEALVEYPSSDGKPMAETPIHRENMTDVIAMLEDWFVTDQQVYVSGNMMMYYVRGDKHRHVSPDVFVARGIAKRKRRPYYLVWEEVAPQCVIELTSASTRNEDLRDKFNLYEQTLKVLEYFLFDPEGDYLNPSLQGYRLIDGKYARIEPVDGRLPSEVTGLHLERDGVLLRLYDPVGQRRLPTRAEARDQALAENEQLRQRISELKGELPPTS